MLAGLFVVSFGVSLVLIDPNLSPLPPHGVLSWAEIHGTIMGIAFGLFAAVAGRITPNGWWLFPTGLFVGIVVGVNLNVSPWEGWWHPWYILFPSAILVYVFSSRWNAQ